MIQCKFCACELDSNISKLVRAGSWFDAEKIYLCNEHAPLLNDKTEIELIDPCYREDESWEGNVVPVKSITVSRMALMQTYLALRGWILMKPEYPRKTPIQNIMIDVAKKLPNSQLMDLNLALLYIHWVTIEDERQIDVEEFDFFNPCSASIFDTMSMQNYQNSFTKYIHRELTISLKGN